MQSDISHAGPAPQDAVSAAAAANSEIDDFIYLISHDVRASVRALLELPQWIKEDLDEAGINTSGQIGMSIDLMNRHTGRLDRMLVDLLSYSRVGRMQTTRMMSLDATLDEVLEQRPLPQGFDIIRDFECETVLMGDRDLPLLLSALISNAVKHHDKPKGRILVRSYRNGANAVIQVADDGPGIEEKFQEQVFAPMTTLRPRDEVEGSGMGLANASRIAKHCDGSAKIGRSPFGRGTSVEVTIAARHQA